MSRTAFLTAETAQELDSPLSVLNLEPADLPLEADAAAAAYAGGGAGGEVTSGNRALSSALGVLGDLGVVGAGIYLAMLTYLIVILRRTRLPEGGAAAGGFALLAVLGVVFDWWEQPPFTVFLAVLAGLALTRAYSAACRG